MSALQIRYYQEEAIWALYDYFAKKAGNPIVAMPTGTGKSVVIAEFLRSLYHYYPGRRVIVLTHVKELIVQNHKKLVEVWPLAPAGIYSAGLNKKEVRPITFGGIASVAGCAELFGVVDFVFVDECHLVAPKDETMYQDFIADLKKVNPHLRVIGLTATPYRVGQGLLTNEIETSKGPRPSLFTDICYNITDMASFNRLVDEGFLCPLIPKRTDTKLDIEGVSMNRGDFNLAELQAAVDKLEITRKAIAETINIVMAEPVPRNRWLVFASGVEHSDHVAAELNARGISARSVHSKNEGKKIKLPNGKTESWRDNSVKWFKEEAEEIRAIVNNGVFTTGFDHPGINLIIVLRPTQSPGLWVQMLGRGTRPAPGKANCLVLDFAANSRRLGPINDPKIPAKRGMKGGGEAPIKICEACGTYNHTSVRFCTCCGEKFPESVRFGTEASTAELIKKPESNSPVVEIFKVDKVTYSPHFPRDLLKPPSLRVVYHCGTFQKFTEFVCLQHGGFAEAKARKWWQLCTRAAELRSPPATVEEAMSRLDSLRWPSHVKVWMNGKHPTVTDLDFSGRAFNSELAPKSGLPDKFDVPQTVA